MDSRKKDYGKSKRPDKQGQDRKRFNSQHYKERKRRPGQPAKIPGCRGLYFTQHNPRMKGRTLTKPDGSEIHPIEPMDYRRQVKQCDGTPYLWLPELFTIDKAYAAFLLISELRIENVRVKQDAMVRPEKGHPDYEAISKIAEARLRQGALPVDVDTVKYNETHHCGVEMLSASHFVATSLGLLPILKSLRGKGDAKNTQRIKYLEAYLDLLEIINRHNQSGYLKAGSHALPYLMREAKKIHNWMIEQGDVNADEFEYQRVVMRAYHTLRTWIEERVQKKSSKNSPYPTWVKEYVNQYSERYEHPWTVGDYIQKMFLAGIAKEEIQKRAKWWHELQLLVNQKNTQKKHEVEAMLYADLSSDGEELEQIINAVIPGGNKEESWIFKKFYFGHQKSETKEYSHTGLLVRHDDEDHVRACWSEGVALLIIQKSDGKIAIMTSRKKRVDLSGIADAIKGEFERPGFHEKKMNAIFLGGTGNWSGEKPENVSIERVMEIVIEHVKVPNPFEGNSVDKESRKKIASKEIEEGTNLSGLQGISQKRLEELKKYCFSGKNWNKQGWSAPRNNSNPVVIKK